MEHHHSNQPRAKSNEEVTERVQAIDPALLHRARRTHHDLDRTAFDPTPPEHHHDDQPSDEALTPPRGYRPRQVALRAPPVVRQRLPSVSIVFPRPPSSDGFRAALPTALEDAIDQAAATPPERERTDPMRTFLLLPRVPVPPPPLEPQPVTAAPIPITAAPIPIILPAHDSGSFAAQQPPERVAHPPPSSNIGTFLLVVTALIATAVAITLVLGSASGLRRRLSYVPLEPSSERELDVDAAVLRPTLFVRSGRVHLAT